MTVYAGVTVADTDKWNLVQIFCVFLLVNLPKNRDYDVYMYTYILCINTKTPVTY